MPVLLTTHLIGDVNRSRVLQAFCDQGPLSRADLARLAGVPRATIGAIVQNLLDAGLVEELEPDRAGKVGKPGRPLWFAPRAGLSVAVGFTADAVQAALVNARGDRLTEAHTPLRTGDASQTELRTAVERVAREVLPPHEDVLGLGVVVPGVCDTAAGVVIASGQLPGAAGPGFLPPLRERFGVPVLVDNDARAQALGEKWFGDGRGLSTFASVHTGEGLGVGLVLDGHVFRGTDGQVGELGHTSVVPGGDRCRCGLYGCWETVATLRWVRAQARELGLPGAARTTTGTLARSDDPRAAELLSRYVAHLATGLANLVNLLGTRQIVLHGDVVSGGEPVRAAVEAATRDRTLGYLRDDVRVTLSSLDIHAGLLGAAGLVLSETFRLAV